MNNCWEGLWIQETAQQPPQLAVSQWEVLSAETYCHKLEWKAHELMSLCAGDSDITVILSN